MRGNLELFNALLRYLDPRSIDVSECFQILCLGGHVELMQSFLEKYPFDPTRLCRKGIKAARMMGQRDVVDYLQSLSTMPL